MIYGVKTITLETLIELKVASRMTAPDRLKDLADVQELIKEKSLDSSFTVRLDSWVREEFPDLWTAVQEASEGYLETRIWLDSRPVRRFGQNESCSVRVFRNDHSQEIT